MKLLIDIGNTTTSFGLWVDNKLSMLTSVENKKICVNAKKYIKKDIDIIFLTSVISSTQNKIIKDCLKKIFKCRIRQIKSSPNILGVKNGYDKPSKLGDDRWVTVVASFILYKEPLLIIDCGTAVSMDIINNKGKHLGGFIFAGFDGYSKSFKNAYHLKHTKIQQGMLLKKKSFPRETSHAITGGYLLMIITAIKEIYNEIKKHQKVIPKILISGSYGKIISNNLSLKSKYEPDLVLKCLGIISDSL
tara:strand:- start:824 stop:1564 length:741 start_codon:yes stop_codon:yes gene_type:complete